MDHFGSILDVLDNITGMSLLSRNTMNTSKVKMFYVGFWVVIYCFELAQRITNTPLDRGNSSITLALIILAHLWVFTMFYRSVVRCRSIPSARLTLQSAQSQLVQGGIEIVPSQSLDLVVLGVVAIINGLTLLSSLFYSLFPNHSVNLITRVLTTFHFNTIVLTIGLGYMHLKISCKIIHWSINKALEDLGTPEDRFGGRKRRRSNREASAVRPSPHIEALVLINKIKMAVTNTENEINMYYCISILWNLAQGALSIPGVLCYILSDKSFESVISGFFLFACSTSLLSFVYASVNGASSKELPVLALKRFHTSRSEDYQTFLRRHILSTIHFGDVDSCVIFNLEYSVLLDVLDYGILILTATCYNLKDAQKKVVLRYE